MRCSSLALAVACFTAMTVGGCAKSQPPHPAVAQKATPHYPTSWWTPVSKDGCAEWEIMPQEAGAGEVILSKRNELGLLSNFAPTPFEFHGKRYASLEGFWQMMKYPEGPDDPRVEISGHRNGSTRATKSPSSRRLMPSERATWRAATWKRWASIG